MCVCVCVSLHVVVCHCVSLCVIACCCVSLCVIVSLHVIVCHCMLLCVIVCHCVLMHVVVCHCVSLHVVSRVQESGESEMDGGPASPTYPLPMPASPVHVSTNTCHSCQCELQYLLSPLTKPHPSPDPPSSPTPPAPAAYPTSLPVPSSVQRCGIPSVTLRGTAEDWAKVRAKADRLRGLDMDWWLESLLPALDHFVRAAKGDADPRFSVQFHGWIRASGKRAHHRVATGLFPVHQRGPPPEYRREAGNEKEWKYWAVDGVLQ